MPDKDDTQDASRRNEGEGNKSAAREFNEAQRRFARSGKVEPAARDAEKALDRDKSELRRAEAIGKRHKAAEDPEVSRKY